MKSTKSFFRLDQRSSTSLTPEQTSTTHTTSTHLRRQSSIEKDAPRTFIIESFASEQDRRGPRSTCVVANMAQLHPSSPPRTTTIVTRPIHPSNPVEIPPPKSDVPYRQKPRPGHHRNVHLRSSSSRSDRSRSQSRPRPSRKVEDVPPSVASLLAVTSIPPLSRRRGGRRTSRDDPMTVDSIIEKSQVAEKQLSLTLCKSPMELLLSAPEDLEDDGEVSISEGTPGSTLSTRTVSMESVPSLGDSVSTATLSSVESPLTPVPRRRRPTRMSLEPITAPGEGEDHPLFSPNLDVEDLDFRVFRPDCEEEDEGSMFRPLKSAFKSNLTASLKALRSAAKSFSSLNFTSIPPEDFLTRSLLTLDPNVPYTDERRPPVLETEPPAALRRYLNPTTLSREETRPATPGVPNTRSFTASIQMQTYKVHRTRSLSQPVARIPHSSSSSKQLPSGSAQPSQAKSGPFSYPPGPRALRENSDFIRIAVMEMAMRRRGKLSDETPGHARLALPPRKMVSRPYEVGPNGIPVRWVPLSV